MKTKLAQNIVIKRVYDPASPEDGCRILAERLWPRGLSKEAAHLDHWLREVAPSTELRKWFHHDPELWVEFQHRYRAELAGRSAEWQRVLDEAKKGKVTLLFSSHDAEHNNVVVLKEFLAEQ